MHKVKHISAALNRDAFLNLYYSLFSDTSCDIMVVLTTGKQVGDGGRVVLHSRERCSGELCLVLTLPLRFRIS